MSKDETALATLDVMTIGKMIAESGYFQDTKQQAQAVVKVLRGQEMGVGAIQSIEGIHIIQGKTCLGSGLIAARIKSSGKYDYRILKLSDTECELQFYEKGEALEPPARFDAQDAERAGLAGKDGYKKYAEDMMFARAITRGARRFCPDVFGGSIYTPEELGTAEPLHGEIIDVTPRPVEPEPQGANGGEDNGNAIDRERLYKKCLLRWLGRASFNPGFAEWITRRRSIENAAERGVIAKPSHSDDNHEAWVKTWFDLADLVDVKTYTKEQKAKLEQETAQKQAAEGGAT